MNQFQNINSNNINNMNINNQAQNNNITNNNIIQGNNNNNINNNNIDNIQEDPFEDLKKGENIFPVVGLRNVGLTCYMNSTLQCLLHIPELNIYFLKIYPKDKERFKQINKEAETHGRLSEEYYNIVKDVFETNEKPAESKYGLGYYINSKSISPKRFNETLSRLNPQFGRFESNDAKDLLLYLFQTMHAELNYYGNEKLKNVPKCNQIYESESYNFFMTVNNNLNLSIFSYLFYGILKSTTKCKGCNNLLYNFQYFQFLSFPAYNFHKQKFNIYKGFKEFTKGENMTGENQCYCQKCKGLKDAVVSSAIFYTPPYLIINFDYGKDKIYKPDLVDFGEIIDLTQFTDEKCKERTYELIAVCTHIGKSGNTGHYIAYCKDQYNLWHKFNDSSYDDCNFSEINSYSPYLLIFKKAK